MLIGGAAVIVLVLICLISLLVCLFKKEKCCFSQSSGFKPASESIVENGCPDNDRTDLTTAKTIPFTTNATSKGKIATIGEDPFYKDGKKSCVLFQENTNGIRTKPDRFKSGNVRILDVEL